LKLFGRHVILLTATDYISNIYFSIKIMFCLFVCLFVCLLKTIHIDIWLSTAPRLKARTGASDAIKYKRKHKFQIVNLKTVKWNDN